MIVVAIIGVLAALAIYGVRRYLAAAKSAEARQNVGAITRSATAAFEREVAPSEEVAEGGQSAVSVHALCNSGIAVPATVPAGRKYQPFTTNGKDFYSGDAQTGWGCLPYRMDHPIYYQYQYTKGSSPVSPNAPAKCTNPDCYEAGALGDLDGDGTYSHFSITGSITPSRELKVATQLYLENETE